MKQRAAILPKGVNRLHHASDARSVIVEQPLVHRRHAIRQCVTKFSRIELVEHLNTHIRHTVSAVGIRIGPMTNLKIAAQIDNAFQTLSVLLQIFIVSRRQFAKRRAAKRCCMPFPLASRPPPYTHTRPNRARFSRGQAEAAGGRRNELRHRAAQLQFPYVPIHLANRSSHTLDFSMRFVHYIVSLGVRHLLTQCLRHSALPRDARIAKTKGRMPLHPPRSLKLKMVPG